MNEVYTGALLGAAVGDALGVPVEFTSRASLIANPVTDYRGYGTWHQPPGTFSDDTSLLLCTADSLCHGFDLTDMAGRFTRWLREGFWGAHGTVFDIGNATRLAIHRLMQGVSPLASGGTSASDNGNGSLMRILPLAFLLRHEPNPAVRYDIVRQVSGITHAHIRSVLACFVYVELAILLLNGQEKGRAYATMQEHVGGFAVEQGIDPAELSLFDRVLRENITDADAREIRSSGYVLDTLESSLWCFLRATTYEEAVLTAVNLGDDTDTTACVAGGLAGIEYGYKAIPRRWLDGLARYKDIVALADTLGKTYA